MSTSDLTQRYSAAQKILTAHKQSHLLQFWDQLDSSARSHLRESVVASGVRSPAIAA